MFASGVICFPTLSNLTPGVFGGAITATPILLVGSSGVFIVGGIYHAYVAAKRGVARAFFEPNVAGPMVIEDYLPKESNETNDGDETPLLELDVLPHNK